MNGTAYKALGYVVWQGGKWYLRKRLPVRRLALAGALGSVGVVAAALAAKRLAG